MNWGDGRDSMKILGVSGSLREASTNTRLLAAAVQLAPAGLAMTLTSSLANLPPFNPDVDPSHVPAVDQWVREVRAAAGVVVSTPEYAGGYPGALKNAFDWLVGTDAWIDKPFMLLNASARSTIAQRTLVTVLTTMSGVHVERASTTIPLLGTRLTTADIVANGAFAGRITESLARFAEAVAEHLEQKNAAGRAGPG
jgi:chromate reductase, NAD(P)H dehydrogenase (quinone)